MKTSVIFVIDGSGSMASKAADVRGGFNTYVDELRKKAQQDDEYELTAVVFNTSTFPLFTQRKLSEVTKLDGKNYVPGGGTALYDAIGQALDEVKDGTANFCHSCGKKRGKEHKFCSTCGSELANGHAQYVVVVMTDGEENSSMRYRKHHIVGKIKEREGKGNWTFVYLGANQDAMVEGTALGIQASNSYNYNTGSTMAVFTNTATATAYRGAVAASTGVTNSSNFYGEANINNVNDSASGVTPPIIMPKDTLIVPNKPKRQRRK